MLSNSTLGNWSDYEEVSTPLTSSAECDLCGRRRGVYKPSRRDYGAACDPCHTEVLEES